MAYSGDCAQRNVANGTIDKTMAGNGTNGYSHSHGHGHGANSHDDVNNVVNNNGTGDNATTGTMTALSAAITAALARQKASVSGPGIATSTVTSTSTKAYRLSATDALARLRAGTLTVEQWARSLLKHIADRDAVIRAWVYLDPEYVLEQARRLDAVPVGERGPMHGLPIAVKDVIYTKDMPTEHNSSIHKGEFPGVDAASIAILRDAGALILGKVTTTEFAATSKGPATTNAHNPSRTPGGSSSGSGAAVADMQAPLALGTQTGGSMIRPASFNGVYALKPTWGSVSREGQKVFALMLDTLGWFARCVDDLEILADVFALRDDEEDQVDEQEAVRVNDVNVLGSNDVINLPAPIFNGIKGARFAVCRTIIWTSAGPGTISSLKHAESILAAHGAIIEHIDLPPSFNALPGWHNTLLHAEGRTSFLPEHRVGKDQLDDLLVGYVENRGGYSKRALLQALDGIAVLRPMIDAIAGEYAAILTPSVPDEAPSGLGFTGSAAFCSIWSTLHTPVVNLPGFHGPNNMPVGVSLVAPRYRDRHLLRVAKAVGNIFEKDGGWKPNGI